MIFRRPPFLKSFDTAPPIIRWGDNALLVVCVLALLFCKVSRPLHEIGFSFSSQTPQRLTSGNVLARFMLVFARQHVDEVLNILCQSHRHRFLAHPLFVLSCFIVTLTTLTCQVTSATLSTCTKLDTSDAKSSGHEALLQSLLLNRKKRAVIQILHSLRPYGREKRMKSWG